MSFDPEPSPEDATAPPRDDDHPDLAAANARAGLWFFGLYFAFYASFMGLSAFAPGLMARPSLGGLNLAVLFGMGLIVAAVALSLIYMGTCRWLAGRHDSGDQGR